MFSDGVAFKGAGGSPEVHYHLYSFERVELQVVVTAPYLYTRLLMYNLNFEMKHQE